MNLPKRITSLLAAGAVLTGLTLGGSALASQPDSPGTRGVSHARAVSVLHQAQRAMAGKGNRDLTITLSRLAIIAPRLSGDQADAAQQLLARPTSKNDPQRHAYKVKEHNPPFCSSHFCIHWVDSTTDAPSPKDANKNGIPDFVERVALVSEGSYAIENGELGWEAPKSDKKLGGNSRTDVYLAQLGNEGLFGFAAPDPGQGKRGAIPPRSEYSYLVMDQNFSAKEFNAPPNQSLSVTIAHEYNHVLQFNYDLFQDSWAKEATATWMEDRVFPAVNDYARYMPSWVRRAAVPLTFFSNAKVYGSAVWNHWLAARYGAGVVLDMWANAQKAKPAGFAPAAYGAAIKKAGGGTFQRAFDQFAIDTAEWNSNGRFPEGKSYPDMKRAGTIRKGGSTSARISHTGYALLDIPVPSGGASIKLNVKVLGRASSAIALVGRIGKGDGAKILTAEKFLRNGGPASVKLANPGQFSRLTAVLVNSDIKQNGYSGVRQDWRFGKDRVPFRISVR